MIWFGVIILIVSSFPVAEQLAYSDSDYDDDALFPDPWPSNKVSPSEDFHHTPYDDKDVPEKTPVVAPAATTMDPEFIRGLLQRVLTDRWGALSAAGLLPRTRSRERAVRSDAARGPPVARGGLVSKAARAGEPTRSKPALAGPVRESRGFAAKPTHSELGTTVSLPSVYYNVDDSRDGDDDEAPDAREHGRALPAADEPTDEAPMRSRVTPQAPRRSKGSPQLRSDRRSSDAIPGEYEFADDGGDGDDDDDGTSAKISVHADIDALHALRRNNPPTTTTTTTTTTTHKPPPKDDVNTTTTTAKPPPNDDDNTTTTTTTTPSNYTGNLTTCDPEGNITCNMTTMTETTVTTRKPKLDIPALLMILMNLTYDYETNLTLLFNETLQKYGIPTCATPTTTSTTTTTTTTEGYDYVSNGTGTIAGKCFVCGLEDEGIPRNAHCSDAFAGDFIPLVPVDYTARGHLAVFRKYCRFMAVDHYHYNASEPRSLWGRWTGGCAVRWVDLSGVYTQRTCRNRYRAVRGRHFLSKRMAKLEMALQHVDNGCIISPMASLVPFSRGVSLFARFHACVCTGSWCNRGAPRPARPAPAAVCALLAAWIANVGG